MCNEQTNKSSLEKKKKKNSAADEDESQLSLNYSLHPLSVGPMFLKGPLKAFPVKNRTFYVHCIYISLNCVVRFNKISKNPPVKILIWQNVST